MIEVRMNIWGRRRAVCHRGRGPTMPASLVTFFASGPGHHLTLFSACLKCTFISQHNGLSVQTDFPGPLPGQQVGSWKVKYFPFSTCLSSVSYHQLVLFTPSPGSSWTRMKSVGFTFVHIPSPIGPSKQVKQMKDIHLLTSDLWIP